MPRDLIIGVGNPILGDDAVGLEIARQCRAELQDDPSVTVRELHRGGMRLMEAMTGYERVFLADAIDFEGRPGAIHRFGQGDMHSTRNTGTSHDGSLADALALARNIGMAVPRWLRVWAVEANDSSTIWEGLTCAVAASVPTVVAEILRELRSGRGVGQ